MREMELWRDKIQLKIRERIQTSMESFTRECLEIDNEAESQEQQQQQYRYNMNAGFADPAIMSASFSAHDGRYHNQAIDSFSPFAGGPPGIPHPPPGLSPTPPTDMAAHGEFHSHRPRAGARTARQALVGRLLARQR